MCEYCEIGKTSDRKSLINDKIVALKLNNNNEIFILSYEENSRNIIHSYVPIDYCPMCR